jgi:hypothetical protein
MHHKVYLILYNIATLMHHIVNTRRNQATLSPLFGWLELVLLPLDVPLRSFGCV